MASDAMSDVGGLPEPEPPAEDHSVQQLTVHTEPVFAVAVNAPQVGDVVAAAELVVVPSPCALTSLAAVRDDLAEGFERDRQVLRGADAVGPVDSSNSL